MNILIVEDEPGLQLGLTDLFEEAGHTTEVRDTGKGAIQYLRDQTPNLVILDLGLPDIDGTRVLEFAHQNHPRLPVMVLTARANDSDIVLGFKMGAFDYVTKPFSPRVLLARTEALLQRTGSEPPTTMTGNKAVLGDLVVDFDRYEAFRGDALLHLTTREIELLRILFSHGGKPVHRNDILDEVWGMDSEAGPRTVDTHIALLRKKIEPNPDRPTYIISQRGIGYKLVLGGGGSN